MAGEPSPAPLVRTRRSTTPPALLRLPSASPQLAAHRATSAGTKRGEEEAATESMNQARRGELESEYRGDRSEHEPRRSAERPEPRVRPPYIGRGSALRPTPLLAPPPFEKLPEKGRSSLPTISRRASTNRERAAPPLSFTPSAGDSGGRIKRGKIRREKPHRLRESFCSGNPARILGRFPTRKPS